MSTAVSSANKINLFNEENEALYDPCPWFTVNSLCEDVPWPGGDVQEIFSVSTVRCSSGTFFSKPAFASPSEWNDAELNAEIWDEGKGGKATTAAELKNVTFVVPFNAVFDDSEPPRLPLPVLDYVSQWKRPQEVFQDAVLTVYDPSNVYFELRVPGSFAPECDFFKAFCEQLFILQFYALKYGFPVEQETPNFVANTQGESWRPWHHIYALCKAGKGQVHKPLYCPFGKYVLRLFYMGTWRKFVVDDKIPCDIEGNCMLPTTQIAGELWPIILMKGLLKILSLTPAQDFSATDFPFLSALTGWTSGSFSAVNKSCEQVWRRLVALTPRYEYSEDVEAEGKSVVPSARNLTVKKESSKRDSDRNHDKAEAEKFCFLLGVLKGVSFGGNLADEYTVAITMTRDRPLVKATKREGTKPWKRIRWIYWAKEKNLWVDENQLPPYRCLQIINFFRELTGLLAPDPNLETALYHVPIEDDLDVEEKFSVAESKAYEPEQWCDYLKFLEYLFCVNVFFKPSYFTCNFKVTCLKQQTVDGASGGKGTSKVSVPQNLYTFPLFLKQTCNEPIFLMCESPTGIFLCISLWVCPQAVKTGLGYLEKDQPKILKIGHASLVVERFDWRSCEQGEIIGLTKTVGYSAVGLNLKPGRHVLKLWLYSDSPYVINVWSNVNVFIQKSLRIRLLMSNESQQILNYIANVSNSFINLTLKFGKPDLPSALRDFYNTIKPGHDGSIGYHSKLDEFIESFINCILLTLKDLIPNVDELRIMMWALRSLFVNPDIQCDLPKGEPSALIYGGSNSKKVAKKVVTVAKERTLSEILNYYWMPEEIDKIVTIQRVFRGFRVRLLWKCQTPGRKEFKPFTERLKKICDVVFVPPKRELEVGKLLRRIVMSKPDLLTTFRFHEDFCNVLQVEEYTGKIPNVEPLAWVPIARFVIACHSKELVPCAFYVSCNLEQFVLQGFNNDTGEEIFRVTNSVSPHYYKTNVKGYTIFVFGWNEANSKTVNWRLEMVKMKHFQMIHLCNILMNPTCLPYAMPSLEVFEIKNVYVPNSKSRICRCFIKIQKRTLLTLRLSTSYADAQFGVMILLDKRFCVTGSESDTFGKVIAKVNSTNGAAMMPLLVLEYIENLWWGESYSDANCTVYILEAFVLNGSWPLTKQEWGLVEPIRVNGESWKDSTSNLQIKRTGSESRKKLARSSRKSVNEQKVVESPSWLLQVLSDSTGPESGEPVLVEEDKSYAESVKAMKMSWEEKDPGRRQRGKDLRMKFLHRIYDEEKKNSFCYGEDYGVETLGEHEKSEEEDTLSVINRLSSFSYLVNDTSTTRYTYSPRILPPVPLNELLCKHRKPSDSIAVNNSVLKESAVTVSQSFNSLDYQTGISSSAIGNLGDELEEDRKDFFKQCLHFRSVLANHMNEEQKLSVQLMEEAYEGRMKAVERMTR